MEKIDKKPVPNYEGLYSITSDGDVISEDRVLERMHYGHLTNMRIKERVLKPSTDSYGYKHVSLCKDSICADFKIHKLVADMFLQPPLAGQTQIRHKNGDPAINSVNNLEWGTPSENALDRLKHGTMNHGEKSPQSKLTNEQVLEIRKRVASGEEMTSVKKDFNVEYHTITKIVYRQRWKHI